MMCKNGFPTEITVEEAYERITQALAYVYREGFALPVLEVGKHYLEAIKKHKDSFDLSEDACMFKDAYGQVVKIKA
jgi:hypothetical protein